MQFVHFLCLHPCLCAFKAGLPDAISYLLSSSRLRDSLPGNWQVLTNIRVPRDLALLVVLFPLQIPFFVRKSAQTRGVDRGVLSEGAWHLATFSMADASRTSSLQDIETRARSRSPVCPPSSPTLPPTSPACLEHSPSSLVDQSWEWALQPITSMAAALEQEVEESRRVFQMYCFYVFEASIYGFWCAERSATKKCSNMFRSVGWWFFSVCTCCLVLGCQEWGSLLSAWQIGKICGSLTG